MEAFSYLLMAWHEDQLFLWKELPEQHAKDIDCIIVRKEVMFLSVSKTVSDGTILI